MSNQLSNAADAEYMDPSRDAINVMILISAVVATESVRVCLRVFCRFTRFGQTTVEVLMLDGSNLGCASTVSSSIVSVPVHHEFEDSLEWN